MVHNILFSIHFFQVGQFQLILVKIDYTVIQAGYDNTFKYNYSAMIEQIFFLVNIDTYRVLTV